MTTIEMGKQYRTRDGREVRIYSVDGGGHYPVHAATKSGDGWSVSKWASDGRYNTSVAESPSDLIEVKPRIRMERWVNVYPNAKASEWVVSYPYSSREYADQQRGRSRIACVKVEIYCEEGDGLNDE